MKYYIVAVIILLILGILFISHDDVPTNIVEEKVNNESRIEIIENGTGFTIFYDKVTNVVYFVPDEGGITPMYNSNGTLYLYPSVG